MTKTPAHNVQIGTIYRAHWGYEQTNVDYYEVVNTTPNTVVLRPIAQHLVEAAGHMSARVAPNPGGYTGPEFRRRITGGHTTRSASTPCSTPTPGPGKQTEPPATTNSGNIHKFESRRQHL